MVKKRPLYEDKSFLLNKTLMVMIIVLVLVFLILVFIFIKNAFQGEELTCGDGTFYSQCSLNMPYFCENGTLVEKSSICGCPKDFETEGDLCFSEYQTNPKNISLNYVLRGEQGQIDFLVYEGLDNYLTGLSPFIDSSENPSRADFKLRDINEEVQRDFILPLVIEIQNLANSKLDQMRIAVSLVQNIPYGESEKTVKMGKNQEIISSRYPYEVLYDVKGICGEKTELLAVLLKEIGYGVVLFYYPLENHEAIGIECPEKYSLEGTGYCFVEVTSPAIITDNENGYGNIEQLSPEPELIFISEGDSLGKNLYEYGDAKDYMKLKEIIKETGKLSKAKHNLYEELKIKYGLE